MDTASLSRSYSVLGLSEGATPSEVRQAYRDLVMVWHPDRFSGDERLQQKAEQMLKEINVAYKELTSVAAIAAARNARPDSNSPKADPVKPSSNVATTKSASELVVLGDRLLAAGRVDEARDVFQQAQNRYPTFPGAHRGIGDLHAMSGRPSNAMASYRRALQYGSEPAARYGLGKLLADAEQWDAVRDEAAALSVHNPELARELLNLVPRSFRRVPTWRKTDSPIETDMTNTKSADLDSAAGNLEDQAFAPETDRWRHDFEEGKRLVQSGRLQEAVPYLIRATGECGGNAQPFKELGAVHYRLHNIDDAIQAYSEAVRRNPERDSLYNLGGLYAAKGDLLAAGRQLDQLLKCDLASALKLADLLNRMKAGPVRAG